MGQASPQDNGGLILLFQKNYTVDGIKTTIRPSFSGTNNHLSP